MNLSLTAYQAQAAQMLRALKGAPLACLHALHLMHPRPLGRADLVYLTDWNKDAVTKAMMLLVNVYFLAARVGRYESWCLTDKGKQLQLPAISGVLENPDARALGEGDFSALPPSSSSSLYIDSSSLSVPTTTTTTKNEGDFSALPQRIQDLIEEFFDGCPRAVAVKAFHTALQRGDPLARLEYRAIAWTLYTQSPHGKSINAPAIFIARKIQFNERAPEPRPDALSFEQARRLRQLEKELEEIDDPRAPVGEGLLDGPQTPEET